MRSNQRVVFIDLNTGRGVGGEAAVKAACAKSDAAAKALRDRGYSEEFIAAVIEDGREEGRRRAKEIADAVGLVLDKRDEPRR
jgi:hypothetical protein